MCVCELIEGETRNSSIKSRSKEISVDVSRNTLWILSITRDLKVEKPFSFDEKGFLRSFDPLTCWSNWL